MDDCTTTGTITLDGQPAAVICNLEPHDGEQHHDVVLGDWTQPGGTMADPIWIADKAGWYRISVDQPAVYLGADGPQDEPDDAYLVFLEPGDGVTLSGGGPQLSDRPDGEWVDIDWDDE